MMHKAWCSIEKVSYCFSRSSIKFQGHTGSKNWRFESNLTLLGRSQLSNPSDLPCLFTYCPHLNNDINLLLFLFVSFEGQPQHLLSSLAHSFNDFTLGNYILLWFRFWSLHRLNFFHMTWQYGCCWVCKFGSNHFIQILRMAKWNLLRIRIMLEKNGEMGLFSIQV